MLVPFTAADASASAESAAADDRDSARHLHQAVGVAAVTSRADDRTPLASLRDPVRAVPLLALLALVLRLWDLGARAMHFDEARVGYWTLRYLDTGRFAYRPIVHGPFLEIATAPLLDAFGPSEFVVRLLPALLGAALPLAALAFRDALDDAEVVALAGFLALNPLLLYFSRFFRADVPLAAFAFGAFALSYRAYRTAGRSGPRPTGHLLAAGVLLGLALTAKENVLVYLLCVAGAGGVGLAVRLRFEGRDGVRDAVARLRPLLAPAVPALLLAVLVAWFFYVPRGYPPGLDGLSTRPVAVLAAGTVGAWGTFAGSLWTGTHATPYLPFLAHLLGSVALGGAALYGAALLGVAGELRREPPRPLTSAEDPRPPRALVVATAAWGLAAIAGYPVAADIMAPWLAVHALVPLAVPAAVGAVAVLRRGRSWWARGDRLAAGALACVLLLVCAQAGFVAATTSYAEPTPRVNLLAQGAQPGDDFEPLAADVEASAGKGGVLYYGERFRLPNESVADAPPRTDPDWLGYWLRRLPLPWYVERAGADASHARSPEAVPDDPPPVVVSTPGDAAEVAPLLDGYERREYDVLLYGGTVVVFTDPALDDGSEPGGGIGA
ncbi:flippase activity-associated protein Agl23 [Halorarum salinum]|uniref:TIGR03663 family protein n=1 Tax=Halorarum salinum TaxID=2743089 RepID=A0A7D5L9P2_9EURY|nr:flippase activity-associated protein Agl23 [Halobaculum salinum]QLG61267.1 TIGR03663 family protein [Halobaculum salinum]